MRGLKKRIEALEGRGVDAWRGPWAWMVRDEGETSEQTIARHEAAHGPLGRQPAIMWCPVNMPCA